MNRTRIPHDVVPKQCLGYPLLLLTLGVFVAGCGGAPSSGERQFRPIDNKAAVFWDRQTTESAELLKALVGDFNAQWSGLPIKIERAGSYADIFRKVTAGINAGVLPAMAVSYESMTSEYIEAGAVAALDDLIEDDALGLDNETLADFFPAMLATNRFAAHDGRLYSFPFAKSVLMLYFNRRVLAAADIHAPPTTWEEFLEQCRAVKARTGKPAHAVSADCSTVNGIIYSLGGDIVRDGKTLYNSHEALETFRLYETLAREELAYLISPNSYDDNLALSRNEIAFVLRSSSGLSDMMLLMNNDRECWGMVAIPQARPETPGTVLYGPNVTLFNTTEDQRQAAWAFVRYFTSPDISARWALETGYLPVRKSALDHPAIRAFWEQWEYNRTAFACLEYARPEPSLAGWQQVRDIVARAVTEIMTGMRDAETAATIVQQQADRALSQSGRPKH